jgi:hypothetical protein
MLLPVGCAGEDGVAPCDELITPPGICSDGNSQEEHYTCEDLNGGPPPNTKVLITCVNLATVAV